MEDVRVRCVCLCVCFEGMLGNSLLAGETCYWAAVKKKEIQREFKTVSKLRESKSKISY